MYPVRFVCMSGAVSALAEFAIFARKLRVCNMPSKADALEAAHGDEVRELHRIHTTARRLKGALEERRPPLLYTDGVLKQWILKYGGGNENAGPSDSRQRYFFQTINKLSIRLCIRQDIDYSNKC